MSLTSLLLLAAFVLACNLVALGLLAINPREPEGLGEARGRGPWPATEVSVAARPAPAGVAAGPLSGRASPASAASPH
ncbi:MAG: hypothetical protein WCK28_11680 [Burkholderiales bacterium]|jgi:hypothetical protein